MNRVTHFLRGIGRGLASLGSNDSTHTRSPLQPADWRQVQQLFEQALSLGNAERSALLARIARDDGRLHEEVASLLEAHERGGPLDEPLADWVEPVGPAGPAYGSSVHQYRIIDKLGGGGMGVVYRAHDTRLDRPIALKFLPPHLGLHDEAKQRFLIEAQAAAALDHPNICTIHEIGESDSGQLFIAMPLYDGQTLKQRIAQGPLPIAEAVDLAIQTARGLAKAHERGIVHRDIKPANLIITSDGLLKVVDFGIAKLTDVTLTRPGDVHGTIGYMSPEHARGEAIDGRSDVWSLGVVLFEMLAGTRPFRGATDHLVLHAILNEPVPPLQLDNEQSAIPLRDILARMLARDPADRFDRASELVRELERYLALHEREVAAPERRPRRAAMSDDDASVETLPVEGERRPGTIVIGNLSGYAGLVDRLPPDHLARLSGRIRTAAEEIASRNGGVLNDFRQDELVLLFGVPVAREDHGMRAVRAALELHERIRALRREDENENPDIRLHTGIGTGTLVVRAGGAGTARYHISGEAVDVARRIAVHAAADEIWISQECHRVVGPFFETDARPAIEQAGIAPRCVLRHTGVGSRLEGALRTGLTRYVGRESELTRLSEALRSSLEGRGRLIVVTGDAGMGKSRLLHEFRTISKDADVQLFSGRCHADSASRSYLPFIEVLRSLLGLPEQTAIHRTAGIVARRVGEISHDLDEFVPLYLHLLGASSRDHPLPRHMHGEQLRVAMQEAVAALITLAARIRPVVLLLEDWHWVDDASHSVLEQLVDVVTGEPLLVVVTSRAPIEWRGSQSIGVLHLEPLDASASTTMLQSIAGVSEFPQDVAIMLHSRTGGNPFFLEEICHALLEEGTLRIDDGSVRLTGPLDSLELPDTVQAVIHTRLERLDPDSRELVRLAAVVGRQFGRNILERAMPRSGRLPNALQALKSAGLIQQIRVVPDAVYRFRHVLTQEVAYGSLLEHRRRELHARVAAAIESGPGEHPPDQLQQLAHHHSRAEHWLEAVDYGIRAADRLHELSEFGEALQQLERCEQWLECSGQSRSVERPVDILLRQERLCETLGLRSRQQKLIDRLIELLEPSGDRSQLAEVYLRQGDLFTLLRRFAEADHSLANSLRLWRAAGNEVGERNTLRSLGLMQWHAGRHHEALRTIEETLALDRERGDAAGIAGDLVGKGAVLKSLGRLEDARAALVEALEVSERELAGVDDLPGGLKLPYILHNLANVHRELGDSETALTLLREALATTEAKHLPVQASYHRTAIAHILLQQGQVDESVEVYRAAVASARKARYSPGLSQALSALGEVLVGLGRVEEASPLLAEAADLFAQLGDNAAAAKMATMRASACERIRDGAVAADCWAAARELHRAGGNAPGELGALEGRARALARAGTDAMDVAAAWREALALAQAISDAPAEARIRNSLGILAWGRGDYDHALHEYEQALTLFRAAGDQQGIGLMLNSMGVTLTRLGRSERAEHVLGEALEVNRGSQLTLLEAHSHAALGEIMDARDNVAAAKAHYGASLRLRQQIGDETGAGWMLHRLACLAGRIGDESEAAGFRERALAIADATGDAELRTVCHTARTEIPQGR